MKVALGQIAVGPEWQANLATCRDFYARAAEARADLLVLPEGIIARNSADPDYALKIAQPLDGPFVGGLLEATRTAPVAVMMTVQVPTGTGKVFNTFVTLKEGRIVAAYRKLHLYDAFSGQESRNVVPGDEVPPLVEIAGFRIGTMTCYDLRFPELARRLAADGADAFVLPAAWVKGPLKERHWEVLAAARALENTCWMVAVGECSERDIGCSRVIDPLGVVTAGAGEGPALVFAELDLDRVAYARKVLPALTNRRFVTPQLA